MRRVVLLVLLWSVLVGCRERVVTVELPTPMDIHMRATEIVLTREAPPAGFDVVTFNPLDANLAALSWRAEMTLTFEGVFARTTRAANATSTLIVENNPLTVARRVVAFIDNDLLGESTPLDYEAVRLGEDVFVRQGESCQPALTAAQKAAADLSAGTLLGGVVNARTVPRRAVINGETVWQYTLTPETLALANVALTSEGRVLALTGELWVAPEPNVVVRFYADMVLENALLFGGTLPVSGTLRLRYDLYDLHTPPNLNVPFGC